MELSELGHEHINKRVRLTVAGDTDPGDSITGWLLGVEHELAPIGYRTVETTVTIGFNNRTYTIPSDTDLRIEILSGTRPE